MYRRIEKLDRRAIDGQAHLAIVTTAEGTICAETPRSRLREARTSC